MTILVVFSDVIFGCCSLQFGQSTMCRVLVNTAWEKGVRGTEVEPGHAPGIFQKGDAWHALCQLFDRSVVKVTKLALHMDWNIHVGWCWVGLIVGSLGAAFGGNVEINNTCALSALSIPKRIYCMNILDSSVICIGRRYFALRIERGNLAWMQSQSSPYPELLLGDLWIMIQMRHLSRLELHGLHLWGFWRARLGDRRPKGRSRCGWRLLALRHVSGLGYCRRPGEFLALL